MIWDDLSSFISYPYLIAHGKRYRENIELIKDDAEDSLPVLNDQKCIIGNFDGTGCLPRQSMMKWERIMQSLPV